MGEVLEAYRQAVAALTGEGGAFALSQPGDARSRRFVGTADNMIDVFDDVVARFGGNAMYEYDGGTATYAQVFDDAMRLAGALRRDYALAPGDRIGIAMHNCPHWLVAFFAVTRSGAVAVLINSRGTGDEMADAARSVGCKLILASDRCAGRLAGATETPVLSFAELDVLIAGAFAAAAPIRTGPDAPALILFTSGTTGRPKGAVLTQLNMCSMIRLNQYLRHLNIAIAAQRLGQPVETLLAHAGPQAVLVILPLFHISGVITMVTAAMTGGLMGLMRRWDPAVAIDMIERNAIASLSGPSLVIADVLEQPDAARRLACLRGVVVGGQASPIALSQRIRETLPTVGQASGYGMTEVTGSVTSASGAVFNAFPGSVGVTLPLADISVRGPDGREVAEGEPGEVAIRGPLVMQGYWDNPAANAQAFDGEWLLTGDIGRRDENGLLYIVDRAKDLVISAGENIYCAEVERVLSIADDLAEVALFGVPDERLGERAVAAVVVRDNANGWDADKVRDLVAQHLAGYKVPSEVVFDIAPLPRNGVGKVDKARLRTMYGARTARHVALS